MISIEQRQRQARLLAAALRYVAVADWFEERPLTKSGAGDDEAMEVFSRVESELRSAGTECLRQHGHRALVLQAAGVPPDPVE